MRACQICGKGHQRGFNVSHAHNKTRKFWQANLRRVRAQLDGRAQRITVCTRCIRSGGVQKAA